MASTLPVRVQLSPALERASEDVRWAESRPTPQQVRGLAALLTPLLAVLGLLALFIAAIFGMKGKKGAAGAAGLAGLAAVGSAGFGGVTAAKPETVLDPKAARVLADPRSAQVKALAEAAERLEAAGPAIAQALLEGSDGDLSPARQRAAAWKRERANLDELSERLDRSLRLVGALGTLSQDDGSEDFARAQEILERLSRAERDRELSQAASAEVDALDEAYARPRVPQSLEPSDEDDERKRRAAAAQRAKQGH